MNQRPIKITVRNGFHTTSECRGREGEVCRSKINNALKSILRVGFVSVERETFLGWLRKPMYQLMRAAPIRARPGPRHVEDSHPPVGIIPGGMHALK
jgi:hypothetical protein